MKSHRSKLEGSRKYKFKIHDALYSSGALIGRKEHKVKSVEFIVKCKNNLFSKEKNLKNLINLHVFRSKNAYFWAF